MGVLDKLTSLFSGTRKNSKYTIPENPGQLAPISNNQQEELNAIHAMAEKINKEPANNKYKKFLTSLKNPNALASIIGKNWMETQKLSSEVTPLSKVPNKPRSVTIGGKRHKKQKKHRKTYKRKQ